MKVNKYLLIFCGVLLVVIVFLLGRSSSFLGAETVPEITPTIIPDTPTDFPTEIPVYNQPIYQVQKATPVPTQKSQQQMSQSNYVYPTYQNTYTPAPIPTTYHVDSGATQAALNQCLKDKQTQETQCTQACQINNSGHEGDNNNQSVYAQCLSNCNPNYAACN